jgi:hypothetical protein
MTKPEGLPLHKHTPERSADRFDRRSPPVPAGKVNGRAYEKGYTDESFKHTVRQEKSEKTIRVK